jgi:hypothetical protein
MIMNTQWAGSPSLQQHNSSSSGNDQSLVNTLHACTTLQLVEAS